MSDIFVEMVSLWRCVRVTLTDAMVMAETYGDELSSEVLQTFGNIEDDRANNYYEDEYTRNMAVEAVCNHDLAHGVEIYETDDGSLRAGYLVDEGYELGAEMDNLPFFDDKDQTNDESEKLLNRHSGGNNVCYVLRVI